MLGIIGQRGCHIIEVPDLKQGEIDWEKDISWLLSSLSSCETSVKIRIIITIYI